MKHAQWTNTSPRLVARAGAMLAVVIATGNVQHVFGQATLPAFGNISGISVAGDTGNESNPRVAGDEAGNLVVVAETNDPAGGVGTDRDIAVAFSSDGGASWSEPQTLNSDADTDSAADVDPEIATDKDGTWVTVWHAVDTGNATTTEIRWARSADNGATWTDPIALTNTVENINTNGADTEARLATDGAGTWIIVWTSSRDIDGNSDPDDPDLPVISSDTDIFFAVSSDNAESFGPAQALNTGHIDDTSADAGPSIATDGAGNWMVVWENAGQIVFARSVNNGTTWTPPLPVNGATGTNPLLHNDGARAATASTAWYCVWESEGISVSRYLESDTPEEHEPLLPDGEAFDEWLAPVAITGSGTNPSIANDSAGRLIVSWQDDDIVASLSVNTGREWTEPGAVDSEGDAGGTDPQAAPVGPDSWVIVWSSSKDRAGSGTDADLVVAPFTFGVFQDCNGNSVDDATDIATGTSEDCNGNGIPDECNNLEADNDGDGIIDACDDTPFGEVDGGGDGGDGSGDGGGGDAGDLGGFAVPCAFGMVAGLPAILLGLTWMKITSRRRRQKPC